MEIEYRTADIRAGKQSEPGFDGHASTWWTVDSYGTAFSPGAFADTLTERGDRIPVLWQHQFDKPIGRLLRIREDPIGLSFSARITEASPTGAEAMALLRDGVPMGMSFGFDRLDSHPVRDYEVDLLDFSKTTGYWASKEGRRQVQIIDRVRLWEVSLVTFPSNEAATISTVRAKDRTRDRLARRNLHAELDELADPNRRRRCQSVLMGWELLNLELDLDRLGVRR